MILEFVFHVILCSVICTIIHLFFHKKHDKCAHDLTPEEITKIKALLATDPNLNTYPLRVISQEPEYLYSCKCKTPKHTPLCDNEA